MCFAILLCLSVCLGLGLAYDDQSVGVYFLKSVSNDNFSAGNYCHWSKNLFNSSSLKSVVYEMSKLSDRVVRFDKS